MVPPMVSEPLTTLAGMNVGALITWAFAHPDLALFGAIAIAILVLGLVAWGVRRALARRRFRRTAETTHRLAAQPLAAAVEKTGERTAPDVSQGATQGASQGATEGIVGEPEDRTAVAMARKIADTAAAVSPAAEGEAPDPALDPAPALAGPGNGHARPGPNGHGSPPVDVREVAELVFAQNFPTLQPTAYAEARDNFTAFVEALAVASAERLTSEEAARFAKADIQILLCSIITEVAKRHDADKNDILVSLLLGRVRHHQRPEIVALLEEAIDVVRRINTDYIGVVVMCLYLRSIHLKTDRLEELEHVVKYATGFGTGTNLSNVHTGALFSHGLLMYNAGVDRVEGHILRSFAPLFEIDPGELEAYPGESAESRQIVYRELHLSPDQTSVLEALGQSQCGRATATGIGWAAAAAYVERRTGQPANWERMVA